MADLLTVLDVRTGPDDLPYVLVQVQWDGTAATRPWLRVTARYDVDGYSESYVLRGSAEPHPGDGITPVTRTFVDPQAPFEVAVTYVAEWATDPFIADWRTVEWGPGSVAATVTQPPLGGVLLLSDPGRVQGVSFRQNDNNIPRGTESRGTLLQIQNRRNPVPIWDVRSSPSGTIQLRSSSGAQLRQLEDLIDSGRPVVSRPGYGKSVITQPKREIINVTSVGSERRGESGAWLDVGFVVVDDPEPAVRASVGTFADMQAVFDSNNLATFNDIRDYLADAGMASFAAVAAHDWWSAANA